MNNWRIVIFLFMALWPAPAVAHDIYTGFRGPDGQLCCGGEDCKPVEAVPVDGDKYYLPASGETLPAKTALPSPDERFHRCTFQVNRRWIPNNDQNSTRTGEYVIVPNSNTLDGSPATRCFFAPFASY